MQTMLLSSCPAYLLPQCMADIRWVTQSRHCDCVYGRHAMPLGVLAWPMLRLMLPACRRPSSRPTA